MKKQKKLPLIHPGEILLEEFLKPMGLSQYRLAQDAGMPQSRITEIIKGRRSITAETALRFAKYFGTTAGFWLGLQAEHDLEVAGERFGKRIEAEVKQPEFAR